MNAVNRLVMNGLLRVLIVCLLFLNASPASSQTNETNGGPKSLRPFYIIGHGANTLAEAQAYLDSGANALEMDVNLPAGQPGALCIGHGPELGSGAAGKESAPLAKFFTGLHELARTHTNFCLVYLDCKTLTATPERGVVLLRAIREFLIGPTNDRMPLIVLISVGKLRDKALFANICGELGPREGLMVDGYSDPGKVSRIFTNSNVQNQAFCDGIVPLHPFFTHFMIYGTVKLACKLRDQNHQIRFVGTWSVNNPWLMIKYIKMGVDGIVVDRRCHWYNFCWVNLGKGIRSLPNLVKHSQWLHLDIRLADRQDNPFATPPQSSRQFD